jgi:hypothetical protein
VVVRPSITEERVDLVDENDGRLEAASEGEEAGNEFIAGDRL